MLEYILLSGCGYLVFGCRYWLPVKATDNRKPTTYNQTPSTYHYIFLFIDILFLNNQTTSFVWKTIPSAARVTRDEVSGLKQRRGSCLEDSTLPVYAHRIFYMFWYCLPDSSFCYSLYPETSSRVTLATLGIGFQPKLPTTDDP